MLSYFRRGVHRQNGFRPTVSETIWEANRIPIEELYARINAKWSRRQWSYSVVVDDGKAEVR